jgi:hypothetical protein
MSKVNKIIFALTIFSFVIFVILAWMAYPRMVWWVLKAGEGKIVVDSVNAAFTHRLFSSLSIAVSAFFIGIGAYIISKKRNLKETIIGWFVLVDVALLAVIAWLVYIKYQFIQFLSNYGFGDDILAGVLSLYLSDLGFYHMGIAAAVAVLLVAWIYPKKLED